MADLLALSWDRRRLTGIEFSPGTAGPRVLGGFGVDWPEQPPTAAWLRETLRRFGVNARQVAVALPREDAVLRLLELPNVADDEMPTLVRFQAAARSAQSIDQLLLDYLPLPLREGVAQKEVWLATTLLTTVDPIRALLTEVGLDLVQVTLSSLCLAELIVRGEVRQSLDAVGASLVVLREGSRMELAVVCQQQLIAAHAVKWSSAHETPPVVKMLAEVSRVLVQVQAWLPAGTLQRIWVIGEDADVGELPDALGRRWNCPVQRFDPWRDSHLSPGSADLEGPPSEYATAAGLAFVLSSSLTPKLDLLHPRQPPPKRDPRKPYIAAAAAAGLLAVALGTAVIQQSLASYDRSIEKYRSDDLTLTQKLKQGQPTFDSASAIEDWQSRSVNQLQQMAELYQVMDGTQRLVIGDYRFSPATGASIAKLKTMGNARTRENAVQLSQNLADLNKFKLRPSSVTPTSRDPDYANRFDFEMDLVSVSGKSSTPPKPGSAPPRPATNNGK